MSIDYTGSRARYAKARVAHAFANVDTMARADLIAFCRWNDPNGRYSDSDCAQLTIEQLRDVVRMWKTEA